MDGDTPTVPPPPPEPAGAKKVNLEDIEKNLGISGAGGSVKAAPPTFTQKVGLYLAIGVGTVIALSTVAIFVDWFVNAPPAIALPKPLDATKDSSDKLDIAKKALDNHKIVSEISLERTTKIFDLVITKGFLPLFTAIVGYLIGTKATKEG